MAVEMVVSEAIGAELLNACDAVVADATSMMTAAKVSEMELSLSIVDDAEMRSLNKEWRGKDYATDVLSFPQDDDLLLGDLVISIETAASQALSRGHTTSDELRILMVHGLLHLFGYDHELGEEERLEMAQAEVRLMSKLGWRGAGLISVVESE
jgi:rRNA maturation RNase YbeY